MQQNILYIGLDVDDPQYHGSAFNKDTGEVLDFKCRPTLKGLLNQLDRMAGHFPGCAIKLCYEASYVGFCLQRDLMSNDIRCDVVAPSSIPSPRGRNIKTDCIDAGYLQPYWKYYDELTHKNVANKYKNDHCCPVNFHSITI